MNQPFSKMQDDAIDFALDRAGSAWFMPPGMGKTRAWLETIRETGGRTLVLAPRLVCQNTWPREQKKWGYTDLTMRFLHGKNKKLANLSDISLMNYESIPWLVEQVKNAKFPFEYVIYDELSKMKNPGSARFHAWKKVLGDIRYRCGGTGTPVGAHLKDIYGEMFVVDKGKSLGTIYDAFLGRYFKYNQYSKLYKPYGFAEEAIFRRIKKRALSFDINDLDLPPISHYPTHIDLPENVRQHYVDMRDESVVEELDVTAVNAAVRSGKLRQFASGYFINNQNERKYLHDAKAEYLKNLVNELQGNRVMIFFEFISDYISLCNVLGKVPVIYGATKVREINTIERKWNAGELPFLALHPRSAAYGLNLQDSANAIVFYTLPWSQELITQSIGRLWRQGQKNKVLVYYLLIKDTIDVDVYKKAQERQGLHDRLMGALL